MRIVEVTTEARAREVHEQILVPSFPREERVTADEFGVAFRRGRLDILVAEDDDGALLGTAVAEYFPDSDVVLLTWLAALPTARGLGLGGRLLDAGLQRWVERWHPRHVLGEVERPDATPATPDHGDPRARVRFYARHGGRALDVPYFQPPIGEGLPRVGPMLLITLAQADEPRDDGYVRSEPIRQWLTALLADEPRDGQVEAVLASVDDEWLASTSLDRI